MAKHLVAMKKLSRFQKGLWILGQSCRRVLYYAYSNTGVVIDRLNAGVAPL